MSEKEAEGAKFEEVHMSVVEHEESGDERKLLKIPQKQPQPGPSDEGGAVNTGKDFLLLNHLQLHLHLPKIWSMHIRLFRWTSH